MSKRIRKKHVSIAIVGEGITEWFYVSHIKSARGYRFKLDPSMPVHSDYKTVFKRAKNLIKNSYDIVFCVIDLDKIKSDRLIDDFNADVRELKKNIIPIASFPCIEAWFLFHFHKIASTRFFPDEITVEKELKNHIPLYEKTEKYLRTNNLYSTLDNIGSIDNAIKNSRELIALVDGYHGIIENTFSEIGEMIAFLDNCRDCTDMNHCTRCIEDIRGKLKSVQ